MSPLAAQALVRARAELVDSARGWADAAGITGGALAAHAATRAAEYRSAAQEIAWILVAAGWDPRSQPDRIFDELAEVRGHYGPRRWPSTLQPTEPLTMAEREVRA